MMKYLLSFLTTFLFLYTEASAQEEPPLPGVFYLEIRQTVQPEEFPRQQLRVYRLRGQSLILIIEGFDDPETEASVEHVLSKECYDEIVNEAERNRLMDIGVDCVSYVPKARPKLKTELKIEYKGETKVCYSMDKPFKPALQRVLHKVNLCIPVEAHKIILPQRMPIID